MKKDIGLILLFALLITFSFPPFSIGFLAYVAVIPFLMVLENKSFKEVWRWGYFAGLLVNLMLLYWIGWATIAGALSAILVLPLYLAGFGALHVFSQKRWGNWGLFLAPCWWTAIEWTKTLGQIGFPWFTLGYSQSQYRTIIQFAEITGVYGVSFWIVLGNVLIYQGVKLALSRTARPRYLFALAIWLLVPYLYGWIRLEQIQHWPTSTIRVALVQGNIDPFKKWKTEYKDSSFVKYEALSLEAANAKPDLIVWPETATPCWLKQEFEYLSRVLRLVNAVAAPLLTGTPDYEFISNTEYRSYNSAILLQPNSTAIQSYSKMRLVPFGERIPFEDSFPFTLIGELLDKLEMGQGNFSPGDHPVVFRFKPRAREAGGVQARADSLSFGVAICYESVFPQIVRDFTVRGAQFLLVITNDGWFGKTSMPFQHLDYAVFRAIENRVSVARATNTGISAVIDPCGRILKTTNLFEEATLVYDLPILNQPSFFVRHGSVFAYGVLILSGVLLGGMVVFRKRTRS